MSIPRQVTRPHLSACTVARGLGWFSIGLGVVQLLAPRQVSRFIGLPHSEGLIRACGVREIVTGAGILMSSNPKPWIQGRIGGDVLDLACLGWSIERGHKPANAALAMSAVAGATVIDIGCVRALQSDCRPIMEHDYADRSGFPNGVAQARGTVGSEHAAARAEPNGYHPVSAVP